MVRILVASLLAFAISVNTYGAIVHIEAGDAGEFIGSAQDAIGADIIQGTLINLGNAASPVDDIDMYRIFIALPAMFAVRATGTLSEDDDMQLFVFDQNGFLAAYDDDSGPNLLPYITPGSLSGWSPGIYHVAVNLYATDTADDPLSGWDRDPDPFQTGPYTLTLETVPEPSTLGMAGLALAVAALAARRMRPH